MRSKSAGNRLVFLGSLLALGLPLASEPASAHVRHAGGHGHGGGRWAYHGGHGHSGYRVARGGGLQCVPFARDESGIELVGNAWTWWDSAAGVYQRGAAPEPGAVLAFRSNRTMRLGHVAVVSRIVNSREIEIEHANWGPGIARDVPVVDVSENNDWTAVRVALGNGGGEEFGSIYPTHGFIYDRPDRGMMVASNGSAPAPMPVLNPASRDLRPTTERMPEPIVMSYDDAVEEVAEAPAWPVHHHRRPHHTWR